jgi:hypothetical protein
VPHLLARLLVASRRREGGDGDGTLEAAAARVSAAAAHGARAARARVGEVPGWRRALNSPVKGPWRAGHAGRERAALGLGGGGGVRGGADAGKGMTCGSPAVSDCERGREAAWADVSEAGRLG